MERWLELVPLDALGLAPSEVLYVPRLPVSLRSDPRTAPRQAAQIVLELLRSVTESAERDPLRTSSGGGACRFSTPARYRAWLLGLWLGGTPERAAAMVATGARSLREWQRRELLRDGPALVAVTAHAAEAGVAVDWLAKFETFDQELAEASLARSFGVDLRSAISRAIAEQPRSAAAWPQPQPSDEFREPAQLSAAGGRTSQARVVQLCRELDQSGHDWRRLAPRGRLLLLGLRSLARAPAATGRYEHVSAMATAAIAPTEFATGPGGPRLPADCQPAKPRSAPLSLSITAKDRRRDPKRAGVAPGRARTPLAAVAPAAKRVEVTPSGEDLQSGRAPIRPGFPSPREGPADTPGPDRRLSFQSKFAGLLFLLNVFVALGLYPDFTGRGRRKLAVAPLWLIDRVGSAWFGRRYRRDPLHRWITANSSGGRLPRDWKVEDDWAGCWSSPGRACTAERAGRATLWHRAGFPLIDEPAVGRRVRRRVSRPGRWRAGRMPRLPTPRSSRWIACLALFLDARIRAATGDRARGLSALALPGKVTVDELDVCASFSLERHPVALRLAGLDRNPAWQPAEGRSFRFDFT
ncbi:MAG: hypothetical protein ACJ8EQ_09290 [Sphingomicrobium sp.]